MTYRPLEPVTGPSHPRRIAFVIWSAEIGGAETVMLSLAQRLRRLGVQPQFIIVSGPGPLVDRLSSASMPHRILGFARGRDVLRHPRRYAEAVRHGGSDGALLIERGFLGAALRAGGYRRPIVAVEHGTILFPSATWHGRMLQGLNRLSGAWADDAEVAVSDLVLDRMRAHVHAHRITRIYNAINPDVFSPCPERGRPSGGPELVAGFVGRLVPGKGLDVLIAALARAHQRVPAKLRLAGDGPERSRLESLARTVGVSDAVEFLGTVHDVHDFWCACDVAIIPSDTWIESFCMAALEAMACARPVIATQNGALPEVVHDGVTGTLVPAGDVSALAQAMISYAERPDLQGDQGAAARRRSVERFDIDDCAQSYLEVFAGLDH